MDLEGVETGDIVFGAEVDTEGGWNIDPELVNLTCYPTHRISHTPGRKSDH